MYSGPTLAAVTSFSTENLVVYDVETGELAAEIAYDKFDLNDETPVMSINELNHSVAVSSASKQISVFDYENDSTRVDLDFHSDTVVGMAYNSDGTILASIDLSGNLILSDGIRETGYLKVGASARNVEFSPDDSLLAVASEKSIKLIDSRTLDVIKEFNAHSELIAGLGFTDDGSMLISSSHDGTIRLWGVPDA